MNESNVKLLEALVDKGLYDGDICDPSDLADFLDKNGVIVAPVKIGQVVYAAIPKIHGDEESIIYAWEVKGIGINEKGKFIAFNSFGEHYTVGEESCRLTKEEAEQDLRNFEAEYAKENDDEG